MGKRFFWVNHKQTGKQEREGGYIWAPKRKKNGATNVTYDNLLRVNPGDIIFSYSSTLRAYGIAKTAAYSSSRPEEFGKTGESWNSDGWRVDVEFHEVKNKIKPSDYITQISPLLSAKHFPIHPQTGNGMQGCYLAEISQDLSILLLSLTEVSSFAELGICHDISLEQQDIEQLEEYVLSDTDIPETEKQRFITARIAQGKFRKDVIDLEPYCRVTKIADTDFLKASHIKPWRHSDNIEKVDPYNGLMLAPHVDHLFDHGWISFKDNGDMMISPQLKKEVLHQLGLSPCNVGEFPSRTAKYLAWHRKFCYRK